MKQIHVFKLNDDKVPLQDWLNSLDKPVKARILERIKRLESGNIGDCKKLDSEISELRFKFGAGYRIYYSEIYNIILLLLCGGDKSSQDKDIKKAKEYLKIYEESQND